MFSKELSFTRPAPRETSKYHKLAGEAADFFREFADALDPHAFPWSHSSGLGGALAAARASFESPACPPPGTRQPARRATMTM